jgi:serine/threonine-protein kinase
VTEDDRTLPAGPGNSGPTRSVTPFTPRTPASGSGRFTPGAIIAGRYRLVALLGRGGMGEVYRADDLTLDQPVALKFLPEGVAADSAHLAQFHNELRTARQVSHRNVVRLYDLGEADGRRFLTMEYVDGEDLASLLRRIGRFPQERALAIARQLCAGVAAAHDRGVIHRDLKPHNVMIDGEGDVRITDFGIATAAADAGAGLAGTPQYMAPEQLTGTAASVKSDLYALGLCLFEIFTGKRAHEAKTLNDLKALHDTGNVTTPSSIIADLDPAIERVIMRCLEKDPQKRPASALAVAAALPGGDPLAAALAAGETPSPEVLAAAAETEAMPVMHGVGWLAAVAICAVLYATLSPLATMANIAPFEKAPAVLADRAQHIIGDFGYFETPTDTAQNFIIPQDFRRWVIDDTTRDRWNAQTHPMAYSVLFWYRTSPRDMEPNRQSTSVSPTDPPLVFTGQSLVILDTKGRLVEFRRVPPQLETASEAAPAPNWDVVLRGVGVDPAQFTAVEPQWSPKDFADARAAWEGPLPDASDLRLRVEAATYRGRVVSVYTVGPWSRPRAQAPQTAEPWWVRLRAYATITLLLGVLFGGGFVARHNLLANRADRKGAGRLALAYALLQFVAWIVDGHHLSNVGQEYGNFIRIFAVLIFQSVGLWMLYLAIEPFCRKFWPDGLLGWTRLLSGRIRDPRIGREILIGTALGGALLLVDIFRSLSPLLIGRPAGALTLGSEVEVLVGFSRLFGTWADQFYLSLQTALIFVMILIAARLLVRRTWLAALCTIGFGMIVAGGGVPAGGVGWLYYLSQLLAIGLITLTIFRYGVLVTVVMVLVDNIPSTVPIVDHGPSWLTLPGTLSLLLVGGLAIFGFYAARAGQPVFGTLQSLKSEV